MTLLIKNVEILGAEKEVSGTTDIFVAGDKISAIGNFGDKKADQVIEGMGMVCAPGFIDVQATSDHFLSLFDNPAQADFLKQGVTTIIGGHCGSSLSPLLYGSLESVRKWADIDQVNVNWRTVAELLDQFIKKPLGVNFGTLVGHSTIRRDITGEMLRDLTKNELDIFSEVLERAMKEGGFGLSTGLGYVHGHATPYGELKFLATIVQKRKGIYATHLRKNGVDLLKAVNETIKLGRETGVSLFLSHLFPMRGAEKEYRASLEAISKFGEDGEIHFGIYPFDTGVFPIYSFLPQWAQNGNREIMCQSIGDEWIAPRILNDMNAINPNDFIVAQVSRDDALLGKTLAQLMELYNVSDYKKALLELMRTTKLEALVSYKSANADLIPEAIIHPYSFITSDAASFEPHRRRNAIKFPRSTSTFTQFLSLTMEKNLMSIKDAIQKITALPAKAFGIANRGIIREGAFADLVVLKGAEAKYVIVNGSIAIENGELIKGNAGVTIRPN